MKRILYKLINYIYILLEKSHHYVIKYRALETYNFGESVSFPSTVTFYGDGSISVGKGTYFGGNCCIISHPEGADIHIGTRCMIAQNVHIRTASYDINSLSEEIRKLTFENIKIGNSVWIGANVFIKGGVTLGNNVTVGANSVVTKSFPDNVVIAGVPAQIIKHIK